MEETLITNTMKRSNILTRFRSTLSIIALLVLGAGTAASQSFNVPGGGEKLVTMNDKVNQNQFIWVSDAPLENTRGTSEGVAGTLTMDTRDLSKIRGTITTQVSTMKSGNETRDHHLKSAEWLDASRFPLISFTITGVSNITVNGNSATGTATGNFTMHGVTKQMPIPFTIKYVPESAKTRERAPGDLVMISADFNVSLKDYKVTGQEGTIGNKVGETIKITAQLFGNALPKAAQ
jgi:polyisoprenoid-binding protein YceI